MKVSELSGNLLDIWVAKAGGKEAYIHAGHCYLDLGAKDCHSNPTGIYSPSTDWAQGGPIIERERIEIRPSNRTYAVWSASINGNPLHWKPGETPLIAAMRCYVSSKFGDEVPDE